MAPPALAIPDAAALLGLSADTVSALIDAGYLTPAADGTVAVSELKAFQARNTVDDDASSRDLLTEIGGPESGADAILDALEASVATMARRTADVIATVFPDAAEWTPRQRTAFEEQAIDRFETILSVTRRSEGLDDELVADLADAGGAAAFAGASLPQILMTLRISRDLMVQTAVTAAEERGRHWGLALAVVLTRVLPVLDHLLDSVARGYWEAVITREQEAFARFESVVEHSASGVYEVDLDGYLAYCNDSMAAILGRDRTEVVDKLLIDLLPVVGDDEFPDVYHQPTVPGPVELRVRRADGVERVVSIHVTERRVDGLVVGFDGVVRDVTAARDLEHQKNDFLALMTHELRQPLTTILGLGATLDTHAAAFTPERLSRMGRSIRDQADRISRLADDLYDVSRLQSNALELSPRRIEVGATVEAGMAILTDTSNVHVVVAEPIHVFADSRRLEQVVAHLVENALIHGAEPVTVTVDRDGETAEITVEDAGPGIPVAQIPTLFGQLRPNASGPRRRDRPTGLGLPLVRGLIEAMGGRVSYRPGAGGGALFAITLPALTEAADAPRRG